MSSLLKRLGKYVCHIILGCYARKWYVAGIIFVSDLKLLDIDVLCLRCCIVV